MTRALSRIARLACCCTIIGNQRCRIRNSCLMNTVRDMAVMKLPGRGTPASMAHPRCLDASIAGLLLPPRQGINKLGLRGKVWVISDEMWVRYREKCGH